METLLYNSRDMLQVDATWFIRRCQIQLGLTGHIFLLIRVEMYSSVEGKKKKKKIVRW